MTNISFSPGAVPFVAVLETDGRLHLNDVPDDEKILNRLVQALVQTQPFGAAWEGEYRTLHLLSGAAKTPVATLAQVQEIAVPHWRRLSGELRGQDLTFTERLLSTDGENWTAYPTFTTLQEESRHPAFGLSGDVIGRFSTLHWREGRIDIEPDPPAELLELLEGAVQMFNGADDKTWQARHEQLGGNPRQVPAAKRLSAELRGLAPLFSPSEVPFVRQFGTEFWPLIPLEYSQDGKKWATYPSAQGPDSSATGTEASEGEEEKLAQTLPEQLLSTEDDQDPFGLLSQLLEMQSVTVTVEAGGHTEWAPGAVPEEYAGALRQSLLAATGAGDPQVWAERTAELLPEGVTGTPQALRLQVMKALLGSDPELLDQSFVPSALTINGAVWHSLGADLMMLEDEGQNEDEAF